MEILYNHLSVPVEYIIYAGVVQFKENCLRLGEAALQTSVRKVLPILLQLTGTLHHCLVSLTNDAIPLMSSRQKNEGVPVFCGFNIPYLIVFPLARQTNWMFNFDEIITQSGIGRFLEN